MSRPSAAAVARISQLLIERHGFERTGNRFTLVNGLMRRAQLIPTHAYPGHYKFDVEVLLGIPGLSMFSASDKEFVVRSSLRQAYLNHRPTPVTFDLKGESAEDGLVLDAVIGALDELCELFLLRFVSAEHLADFVRDEALDFRDRRMLSDGTFRLLMLQPWNVVPRLELAAVYAAFLGREEADSLEKAACTEAVDAKVEYAIPRIHANVRFAREVGQIQRGHQLT